MPLTPALSQGEGEMQILHSCCAVKNGRGNANDKSFCSILGADAFNREWTVVHGNEMPLTPALS